MTTVIGTRIHQLEMSGLVRQLQFMIGSLQESRIPMDCLHNLLRHLGALEVCRVTEAGRCSLVVSVVLKTLAKPSQPYNLYRRHLARCYVDFLPENRRGPKA
jgi:hypothetical protein